MVIFGDGEEVNGKKISTYRELNINRLRFSKNFLFRISRWLIERENKQEDC